MTLSKRFLLDVNVLVALTSKEHEHYRKANSWFNSQQNAEWGVCPLTEAGYMRLATNPNTRLGAGNFPEANAVLVNLAKKSGYCYWPMKESWGKLTAPFEDRIFGHQQVTDAFLLGLAIKENGVLVTFDRGLKYMAGSEFSRNLLVLE
jgi:toxin-antitoxin system PIN domain toxin